MGKPKRLELQNALKEALGTDNVYFQPPENSNLIYPCIVYERDNTSTKHADNQAYAWQQRYQVTYIDKDPDSDMIDTLVKWPYSAFSRHFATSGLNHDVFVIYH